MGWNVTLIDASATTTTSKHTHTRARARAHQWEDSTVLR